MLQEIVEYCQPLSDFGVDAVVETIAEVSAWYEGRCPHTGQWHRLPRTTLAEAIARQALRHIEAVGNLPLDGKMYGVLLAKMPTGEVAVLKAFSGLWWGRDGHPGWVPPIPGRDQVALQELQTLSALEQIKTEILHLRQLPSRDRYLQQQAELQAQRASLAAQHRQTKRDRQCQREHLAATLAGTALADALADLDRQSQQEGIARRRLKQAQDAALAPLKAEIDRADARLRLLKQRRKHLSRQLQDQMHRVYQLTNFAGESVALQQLSANGLPTGTGDCAAPKLLHFAARHGLVPLAIAEIWGGPPSRPGDRQPGQFYGPCADRCQPILGFLLSGLPTPVPIASPLAFSILYEDEALIAVEKPPGLLTVPGRTRDRQDSILSRLQAQYPNGDRLRAVHRLDQATSGIVLVARTLDSYRILSQQFAARQVHKRYEAIVVSGERDRLPTTGTIDLPLWGDPTQRPRQQVHWHRGKPSLTQYRLLSTTGTRHRVEFRPITGRTHQLRLHAAHPQGLNAPILGDALYGPPFPAASGWSDRLHLHAGELRFLHPLTQTPIHFTSPVPF